MMADTHYNHFSQSGRRGSTGSLYTGQSEHQIALDVCCPNHLTQMASSICQNSLCGKLMCRRCQQTHASANHYKDTLTVGEFIKTASVTLQQSIRTLKEKQINLKGEIKQSRQNIVTFVDQFFTHLSTDVDRVMEKAVCQLETRYLNIRKGNSMSLANQLAKGCAYQLPTLQIDQSNICLQTVLKRMIHLTKSPYSGICNIPPINPNVPATPVISGSPTIYITPPIDDITKTANITSIPSTAKYFAFPQTSYKHRDERRNVSLQRQMRMPSQNKRAWDISKEPVVKDSLLLTSRMYSAKGDKDSERPSLPTQPFAQILQAAEPQLCPLKECITSPNLERATSQRTFSPYEIEELLKKTSNSASKQPQCFAESRFSEVNTDKLSGKQNKDLSFMHSEKYFKTSPDQGSSAKGIYNFYQSKPSTFTDLPTSVDDRAFEYRPSTCTDLPVSDHKPSTAGHAHRETYHYKYARQDYTAVGGYKL